MRASVFDIEALSDSQIGTWDALLAALSVPSPFLSHAFCRAVNDCREKVRVVLIETASGISGFLPFQMKSVGRFLGHAEKAGGALSDMFGVVGTCNEVLDPNDLLQRAGISSLRFDHGVSELCPFACEESECTLGVRIRVDDFPMYMDSLRTRDKEFVKTVERGHRQLERDFGEIRFLWHTIDPHREIDRLIAFKREQYRRTGKPDGFRGEWHRRLLHRLENGPATDGCRLVLSTLCCGETWIASNLSLECHGTLHVWYPVYDLRFRRYGPGHVLFFELFRHGHAQAIRWFDFGEGESSYKLKYGGDVYRLWKGVIRRSSPIGRSERVLQSLEWRVAKVCRAARIGRGSIQRRHPKVNGRGG
ncbi:MAG TPA: GNAT family N-acetyltransferase [Rhizomicrobium sp.]|jgi:CelD/BcsL family acetyltransferase involved in cellulose biosynthesis|nr:GNAT family N-acetyltransferase [Rhizomicrobium sp.]